MKIQNVTEEYLKIAIPKEGAIIYGEGYRMGLHGKEIKIADWLHNTLDGDIMLLNEDGHWNKKTPDFIWNEKEWELKSISSAKAADSALRTAAKQIQENPGGVILELGDDIDMDELEKILLGRFRRVHIDELDILMVMHGALKKILRYKK